MLKFIATTRFNNETWTENQDFIKEYTNTNPSKTSKPIRCIYPVSHIIQAVSKNSVFYILEMNNQTNKIMGIGLVKNIPIYNKYNVYKKPSYNQFAYVGYYRIDRKDMNELEEVIMRVFDYYCFKGKTHLKRLKGIKLFPKKILDKCDSILDLLEFITKMFLRHQSPGLTITEEYPIKTLHTPTTPTPHPVQDPPVTHSTQNPIKLTITKRKKIY